MGAKLLLWLRTTVLKWLGWWGLAFALNVLVALPFLLSRVSGTNSAWTGFPLDDTWIHLVYVRSLATQGGLYYNPGIWEAGATSWGWVFFLTPFYLVGTLALHIDVVIVVKFVGLALGGLCTLFAYLLLARITKNRPFSLLGATLLTLEPTLAFHRISGMEGTLLVATVLGASLALLNRRWLWAGTLIAFSFWTRPDAAFYVAAALGIVGVLWLVKYRREILATLNLIWIQPKPEGVAPPLQTSPALPIWPALKNELLPLALPSLLALGSWLGYNQLINGTLYPNTYLVKHDFGLPLLPLQNIYYVIKGGMVATQPWLQSWLLLPTIALCLYGIWYAVRRSGLSLVPLALFPLLLVVAVGKGMGFGDYYFSIWLRRYVDPATPILLFFVLLGAFGCLTWLRSILLQKVKSVPAQAVLFVPGMLTLLLAAAFSIGQDVRVWKTMITEFSWNTCNVNDVDVAAGKWLRDNTPADATVLATDAGAIRYFGERFTYDAVGLNYHDVLYRPRGLETVLEVKPAYFAIWEPREAERLPNSVMLQRFTTPHNTILAANVAAIFALDWSEGFFKDPAPLHTIDYQGSFTDQLRVYERSDCEAHNLFLSYVRYTPPTVGYLGQIPLIDRGVAHNGPVTERFTMAAVPNKPLTLILRYQLIDKDAPEILVDGVSAGKWAIPNSDARFQESSFTIPAALIKNERVTIEIHWEAFVTEFRWWAIAGEII